MCWDEDVVVWEDKDSKRHKSCIDTELQCILLQLMILVSYLRNLCLTKIPPVFFQKLYSFKLYN